MKKLIGILGIVLLALSAPAQTPINNQSVPIFTPIGYPTVNYPSTDQGANLYDTLPTPASDTLRITFKGVRHEYTVVNVTHNLILLFDTTGDTIFNYNARNNIAGPTKLWVKKTPFIATHNLDDINLYFEGTSSTTNYKVTVPWYFNGLAGDTIHVPKKTASNQGSSVKVQWLYQKAIPIWSPYTLW